MRPAQHGGGERTIRDWPLANGETLRLRICEYKSAQFADLRRWYVADDGELRPSPRGVRFNVELIGQLVDALNRIDQGFE